ncbi:MAG: hypothetical protein HYV36_06680 [Lentisphaerae bacterium]|nr:hypothetical protein [Lentisphaerota bacterium]
MTRRAILLGLLGAAAVCGLTYFNDAVMHATFFIGNNLPISVYGALILFVILFNPLMFRFWKRLALSTAEIAVALALTLSACCIPGSGLLRTLTPTLIMPFHYQRLTPAWQEHKALEAVPSYMLANVTKDNESDVLNGFIQGLGAAQGHIAFSRVPWAAWVRPLAFWLPLVLILWIALLGLALVVHRQWSDHEQLPYPIAAFTHSLLTGFRRESAELAHSRIFWIGLAATCGLHLNNYACAWFPQLIPLTLSFNFSGLLPLFPTLMKTNTFGYFQPTIYLTVVAFAYFLASDVSLALGLGPLFWLLVAGTLAGYGISVAGSSPNITEFAQFGAYLATVLVLVYTGRNFYGAVLRRAVGLSACARLPKLGQGAPARAADTPPPESVWGARLFLAGMVILGIYLSALGRLDWQLAVLFLGGTVLTFLVMSRIIAETGCFFIQAYWYPHSIIIGFFGITALGAQSIAIMAILTAVLLLDQREAFMPFTINSLKLLDLSRVSALKIAKVIVGALLIGLTVAVAATLYFQYDRGANMTDNWATSYVPMLPFQEQVRAEQRLESQQRLAQSAALAGWERFACLKPDGKAMLSLAVAFALALAVIMARLRFSRWPIHPVFLLVWATYPANHFAFSFLLGWVIKALVTRYGGSSVYRALKPLMVGLIAGEMLGGGIPMLIGFVYYLLTGLPPKTFSIMPG